MAKAKKEAVPKQKQPENDHTSNAIKLRVCELLMKGEGYTALIQKLRADFGFTEYQAHNIYMQARKMLAENTLTEIDQIIHTHSIFYEKIWQYFDEINFIPGKLKAMKRKESLLGLHKEESTVEINNELNVESEQEPEYNINKLTKEEQDKFLKYLSRIR